VTRGSTQRSDTGDGRVLRSERSREAIAGALFELVGQGHPEPTAQQVAERAGVGIRTVFRLFSDMEALYATLDARLLAEVMPLLRDAPPEGADLGERATALVADRGALFERVTPYKRASNLKRGRSPFLADQHRKLVRRLRARLLGWLPELRDAPADLVEALDQATSFEAWDRLRSDQHLSRPRARAAMERAVKALVNELQGAR
jgi:AcrR family transcriptional regulator